LSNGNGPDRLPAKIFQNELLHAGGVEVEMGIEVEMESVRTAVDGRTDAALA
jgi:hypothetical protein